MSLLVPAPSGASFSHHDHWRHAGAAVCAALLLCFLRYAYAFHYVWNTDEPQHLHVVWAWTQHLLPYRDIFDNHAPLFHLAHAPLFQWLGERPDLVARMRLAMAPWFALSLWLTYRLGRVSGSRHSAALAAGLLAFFPKYFLKMGEFRTDVPWTVLWLAVLVLLTAGMLGKRRTFLAGLLMGACLGVSLKAVFLIVLAAVAGAIAYVATGRPGGRRVALPLALGIFGGCLVPLGLLLYFYAQGALEPLRYCLLTHSLLPGEASASMLWARAASWRTLAFLPVAGVAAFRWPKWRAHGRQLFLLLIAGLYFPLLHLLWPAVTPQDYLPWFPVLFAAVLPPLFDAVPGTVSWRLGGAIGLGAAELAWMFAGHSPFRSETGAAVEEIREALLLTKPGEYLMDAKGDTIFRPRPYYFALETFTRKRLQRHLLPDDVPACLCATGTAVVDVSPRMTPESRQFIAQNYLLVGEHLAVAGKWLPAVEGVPCELEVLIPQEYSLTTADGAAVAAILDGEPLSGSRWLERGPHRLLLTQPAPSVALLWSRALREGFTPASPHSLAAR